MGSQQRDAGRSETPPEWTVLFEPKASSESEANAPSEGSQPSQQKHSQVPQEATRDVKSRTPLPPLAAPTRPPHTGWEGSSVNMAKCDFCDLRNRNNLQKCVECQLSICKGCFDSGILDDDSRHFLDGDSVDWDGPNKPKRGGKTGRARARAGARGRGGVRARGRGGRPKKTVASRAAAVEAAAEAAEAALAAATATAAADTSPSTTITSHDEIMGDAYHVPGQETQVGPVPGYPPISRRLQPPPRNAYTLPPIRDLDRQADPLHNHLAPLQPKREYLQVAPPEPKREYPQLAPLEPLIPRLARQLEADALASHSDVPAWPLDQCLSHEVARAWTRRGAPNSLLREVSNGPDHTGDVFRHLLGATYHAAILLRLERQNAARQWTSDMEAYLCREGLMRPVRAEYNARV
ncbi:hypothetical protein EDB81DRAFT_858617 [Dactylonectria macrodidyma]|uniref:Uncharacterized protein n=1 Tax=Dactylonectria macrodidyma TaxID=307937 RepID=A0A9P9IZF9_9HYPO|nr:hypothetical protein EDB81DRAFT_858617 [Dactylonectria macrodidyma]